MKNTFEKLQARLELIPESFSAKDQDGYKFICDLILQEEGWTEEEYMGAVLSRVAPEIFSKQERI
jgi:hypothetical protein